MKTFLRIFLLCLLAATAAAQRRPQAVDSFDSLVSLIPSPSQPDVIVVQTNDNSRLQFRYYPSSSDSTNDASPYVFATSTGTGRWKEVPLTGSLTNVFLSGDTIPSSQSARTLSSDASLLYTVGDSFTFGASATSYTNTYVSKLAASIGLSAENIANGSFTIADANWIIFPGWTVTNNTGPSDYTFSSPTSITEDQNWTVLIGFNDLRTGSGTGTAPSAARYRLGLDHLIHYLAIPDSAKRWAVSPDASTGSWTESTWTSLTNKAASSSSGTLTFSNVIGSEVYIGFLAWATNYGGTISVEVDGVSVASQSVASAAYGNREYINGSDPVIPDHLGPYGNGKIDFCPQLIRATGLGLGAHTVVVTAASNPVEVIWVAGNGWKRTLREGPNVFLGTIPRQSPWTGAGTDALQASYNTQLRASANTARSSGLRVAVAPVGEFYDPATEQDVDGVHPNNTGHTTIAEAFESAMTLDVFALAGLGYEASLPSAGTFSTLSVSGTSSLVGNVTLGGRLLVLPTATGGGVNSRFGFGTVGASTVSIQHSDTGLDRALNISGNSISVTVNSTGAATSLALGTSGQAVAIQGNETVAGTLGVTGITTLSERLLVTPTPGSGGFSSRFGAGSVAASSVVIVGSDTGLDRELTLTGNSVSAKVNSTGANANLALGTSGLTTAIQGNATVAGTLDVTGLSTFNTRIVVPTTATGGGNNSVFGTSGTTNSAIVVVHDDSGLDRRLTISGNSIGAKVNSTAADANLSLGASGVNVAVAGTATIASSLTVSGPVQLDGAPDSDDIYQGIVITERNNTGGVTQWDAVYLNGSSQWVLADANGSGTYPARGLAVATVATGNVTLVLVHGTVRNDAWNWTPGGTIYLSATAGGLTQTAPSTSGDKVQQVGFALSADIAFFDFNSTYVEVP